MAVGLQTPMPEAQLGAEPRPGEPKLRAIEEVNEMSQRRSFRHHLTIARTGTAVSGERSAKALAISTNCRSSSRVIRRSTDASTRP